MSCNDNSVLTLGQGPKGDDGSSSYTYIAYATVAVNPNTVTSFSLTDSQQDYTAIITSTTPLTPLQANFSGHWVKRTGTNGLNIIVKDEGITTVSNATTLNYVGGAVTVTSGGAGIATITINGLTPTIITRAALITLIGDDQIVSGQPYLVYNILDGAGLAAPTLADDFLYGGIFTGIAKNSISNEGIMLARVPDYAGIANYYDSGTTYASGEHVTWGGSVWVHNNTTTGTPDDPLNLDSNWTVVARTNTTYYISEIDIINYNITSNRLQSRKDKRGNYVELTDQTTLFGGIGTIDAQPEFSSNINRTFQWGNDNVYGNTVLDSLVLNSNINALWFNNTVEKQSYYYDNSIEPGINFGNNQIEQESDIHSSIFNVGFTTNTLIKASIDTSTLDTCTKNTLSHTTITITVTTFVDNNISDGSTILGTYTTFSSNKIKLSSINSTTTTFEKNIINNSTIAGAIISGTFGQNYINSSTFGVVTSTTFTNNTISNSTFNTNTFTTFTYNQVEKSTFTTNTLTTCSNNNLSISDIISNICTTFSNNQFSARVASNTFTTFSFNTLYGDFATSTAYITSNSGTTFTHNKGYYYATLNTTSDINYNTFSNGYLLDNDNCTISYNVINNSNLTSNAYCTLTLNTLNSSSSIDTCTTNGDITKLGTISYNFLTSNGYISTVKFITDGTITGNQIDNALLYALRINTGTTMSGVTGSGVGQLGPNTYKNISMNFNDDAKAIVSTTSFGISEAGNYGRIEFSDSDVNSAYAFINMGDGAIFSAGVLTIPTWATECGIFWLYNVNNDNITSIVITSPYYTSNFTRTFRRFRGLTGSTETVTFTPTPKATAASNNFISDGGAVILSGADDFYKIKKQGGFYAKVDAAKML